MPEGRQLARVAVSEETWKAFRGAALTQDKDETRVLYGKFEPFSDILNGKVRPTSESAPFLAAIRKYSIESRESGKETTSSTNGPGGAK